MPLAAALDAGRQDYLAREQGGAVAKMQPVQSLVG
jgi:hypothetical protein